MPQARCNLGVGLYHLGHYTAASAQCERVVAQEPTSVDPAFHLAHSLAQAGCYAEAMQWYQRTLTLHPRHQLAREHLQVMHERNTARQ